MLCRFQRRRPHALEQVTHLLDLADRLSEQPFAAGPALGMATDRSPGWLSLVIVPELVVILIAVNEVAEDATRGRRTSPQSGARGR